MTVLYGAAMQAVSRSIGSRLEELHRLTQVVYRSASQVAQQYAGTLQLIPGEGFLMVFGVPLAQEDHAQRAVLAALGLQRRLYEAPAALPAGEALGLRIALHSGLIVAGQLGDEPLAMVVGETATVAAALARHAAPGTILASEATLRFVQGEVRTIPVPALQIAEHTPPIPLAQIQQFIPRHMPLAVIEARPRSPFVGREAELAVLQERLTRVEQGQGQVVGVVGEPGIGKSRLLDEFRLAHSTRAVVYLHGECQSYGQTTPYFPLQAVIRAAWGVTEADPAAVMTKVQSGLHAMALEPERWAPYFLPLLGVHAESKHAPEMSAEHLQERLPEALHQFFIRHSQRQPYILALENLHWLDTSTAAYLPRLVERLAGVPILLLVTFRPGYRPLWLAKSYATQIALQPLGDDDSRVIVRTMLHHTPCPAALEHQIMQNAEGNPFFLEELAQTVLEHRPPRSTVVIPESIQAVIAARIDRLLPEEKRLLQTVAALGKEVSLPLLQAVVGTTAETLLAGLARLQAAEFLSEIRLVPEPTYTFKHVLTQAVAYNSLLQEQRRALHARIVDVLGTFAANQVTEQVDELAQPAWRGAV